MENNGRRKYLFVINNGSGRKDNNDRAEKIKEFLSDDDADESIYILPDRFDVAKIKKDILDVNPQIVVAVGGDGTVTMLANFIAGTDIALGIIPGGSANGMAKELDIPEAIDNALEIIKTGKEKHIDLIKINDTDYCLHLSDIGLNAHLIKHFEEGKLRGKLGYALVIIKTLWKKEKMQVIIQTNEVEVKRNAFMVAFANARKYGTGAVLNPEGKLDDGLFEVIIVRKLAFGALLRMLLKPGMFNPKNIEIIPCTAVEIKTLRRVHFQIDGEYKGKIQNIKAVIKKGLVKMILPA
jgi:diacylglycerol kinase (ATP)